MSTELSTRPLRGLSSWFGRDPFRSLREEMDDLFSHFPADWDGVRISRDRIPSMDLSESNGNLEVKLDLPGVKPEEIDIEISGDILCVTGEHKEEQEEKGKTYHRIERRSGTFCRTVTLPCPVKQDEVTAEFENGVLNIKLPKTEKAKPHKIKVKA